LGAAGGVEIGAAVGGIIGGCIGAFGGGVGAIPGALAGVEIGGVIGGLLGAAFGGGAGEATAQFGGKVIDHYNQDNRGVIDATVTTAEGLYGDEDSFDWGMILMTGAFSFVGGGAGAIVKMSEGAIASNVGKRFLIGAARWMAASSTTKYAAGLVPFLKAGASAMGKRMVVNGVLGEGFTGGKGIIDGESWSQVGEELIDPRQVGSNLVLGEFLHQGLHNGLPALAQRAKAKATTTSTTTGTTPVPPPAPPPPPPEPAPQIELPKSPGPLPPEEKKPTVDNLRYGPAQVDNSDNRTNGPRFLGYPDEAPPATSNEPLFPDNMFGSRDDDEDLTTQSNIPRPSDVGWTEHDDNTEDMPMLSAGDEAALQAYARARVGTPVLEAEPALPEPPAPPPAPSRPIPELTESPAARVAKAQTALRAHMMDGIAATNDGDFAVAEERFRMAADDARTLEELGSPPASNESRGLALKRAADAATKSGETAEAGVLYREAADAYEASARLNQGWNGNPSMAAFNLGNADDCRSLAEEVATRNTQPATSAPLKPEPPAVAKKGDLVLHDPADHTPVGETPVVARDAPVLGERPSAEPASDPAVDKIATEKARKKLTRERVVSLQTHLAAGDQAMKTENYTAARYHYLEAAENARILEESGNPSQYDGRRKALSKAAEATAKLGGKEEAAVLYRQATDAYEASGERNLITPRDYAPGEMRIDDAGFDFQQAGECAEKAGDFERASQLFERAARTGETNRGTRFADAANTARRAHQYERAMGLYDEAARSPSQSSHNWAGERWRQAANCAKQTGDTANEQHFNQLALDDYREFGETEAAADRFGSAYWSFHDGAYCAEELGNLAEAARLSRRAGEMAEQAGNFLGNAAWDYGTAGRYHEQLGLFAEAATDYQNAEQTMRRNAEEGDPQYREANLRDADTYRGLAEAAEAKVAEARALAPARPPVAEAPAPEPATPEPASGSSLEPRDGGEVSAESLIEEAKAAEAENPMLTSTKLEEAGNLYATEGQHQKAMTAFARAGSTANRIGDFGRAADMYDRAVSEGEKISDGLVNALRARAATARAQVRTVAPAHPTEVQVEIDSDNDDLFLGSIEPTIPVGKTDSVEALRGEAEELKQRLEKSAARTRTPAPPVAPPPVAAAEKSCPLCHTPYDDWIDFCMNDGTPLVSTGETGPAPALPEPATSTRLISVPRKPPATPASPPSPAPPQSAYLPPAPPPPKRVRSAVVREPVTAPAPAPTPVPQLPEDRVDGPMGLVYRGTIGLAGLFGNGAKSAARDFLAEKGFIPRDATNGVDRPSPPAPKTDLELEIDFKMLEIARLHQAADDWNQKASGAKMSLYPRIRAQAEGYRSKARAVGEDIKKAQAELARLKQQRDK